MLVFSGEADRRFRETEMAYFTAWHSGLFSQQYERGKFPKYEKNAPTRKRKSGPAQTWQQQKMIAKALNAAFGGTVTKRGE